MSKPVAVITGATSGIGASTAGLLASKGWRVVVAGRRQEQGDEVCLPASAAREQPVLCRG